MNSNDSGYRWGPFALSGNGPWRLRAQHLGGDVIYPYPTGGEKQSQGPEVLEPNTNYIYKGNLYENHTHPMHFPQGSNFYFWDNCLIPQIQHESPNPTHWCRLVYNSAFPHTFRTDTAHRARRTVKNFTPRSIEHIAPYQSSTQRTKRILWARSSNAALRAWYGVEHRELELAIHKLTKHLGCELIQRIKPPRTSRQQGNTLVDEILHTKPQLVIVTHSAGAFESASTGTPTLALGGNTLGPYNMSYEQAWEGNHNTINVSQYLEILENTLHTVYHKQTELFTGNYDLTELHNTEPYQDWSSVNRAIRLALNTDELIDPGWHPRTIHRWYPLQGTIKIQSRSYEQLLGAEDVAWKKQNTKTT